MTFRFKCVILLCSVLLLINTAVLAQDPEGWDDNSSADTPIDGGLSLLVAAGAGYGIRKMRKNK